MKDKVGQIKIYENTNRNQLEQQANDFLNTIGIGDLIDIKYNVVNTACICYSIMIIYKKALGIKYTEEQEQWN